jgi:alkyl sulfatase BDS1-like metallo-beta-lactamase superfamily hydrolase
MSIEVARQRFRSRDQIDPQEGTAMADATTEFFDALARRGHDPMLGRFKGSIRFDLGNGRRTDHYRLAIKQGDITISQDDADADCVIRIDRTLLNECVVGEKNIVAAFLRGEVGLKGDTHLLVLFQRLLPGPQRSQTELITLDAERRQS